MTSFAYWTQIIVMAQTLNGVGFSTVCHRLPAVKGQQKAPNDVIVYGSLFTAKQHVIFFGGDVQDYKENMEKNNPAYVNWDLETTAHLLQSSFKDSAVLVIKPSVMFLNTFSIYRNFLDFDDEGKPEFGNDFRAFGHLTTLYKNVLTGMMEMEKGPEEMTKKNDKDTDSKVMDICNNVPIKIVGFSKGCVVLNQLMYELCAYRNIDSFKGFLSQISSIYWLDGGHVGRSSAYITDEETLQLMVEWNKEFIVHVTPYQIKDPVRKWIGKEEKKFVEKLESLSGKITEYKHFMDEPGSIKNHFRVLTKV